MEDNKSRIVPLTAMKQEPGIVPSMEAAEDKNAIVPLAAAVKIEAGAFGGAVPEKRRLNSKNKSANSRARKARKTLQKRAEKQADPEQRKKRLNSKNKTANSHARKARKSLQKRAEKQAEGSVG